MYKTLCVAVLLLPTFALAQTSKPSSSGPFNSPQIVAKGKLPNQTAPIPTTTIFTPTQTGLYRLSVYATISKADPNSGSYWAYTFNWTDDSGVQSQPQLLIGSGPTLGQFYYQGGIVLGGTSMPFQVKAGTPITHDVTQYNGPDNSAYSLYYTLERLE
jgi:hypothetical protein